MLLSPSTNPCTNKPNNTRWLNRKELHLAQTRLAEDAGEADKDEKEDS